MQAAVPLCIKIWGYCDQYIIGKKGKHADKTNFHFEGIQVYCGGMSSQLLPQQLEDSHQSGNVHEIPERKRFLGHIAEMFYGKKK